MRRFLSGLCVLLLVAACGTPVEHHTASGKPEVTIASADVDGIKAYIANQLVNDGYSIAEDTRLQLVMEREVDSYWGRVLLGSRYDGVPMARIAFSFLASGGNTRVVADLSVLTNPGSAFERRTDMNHNVDSPKIQALLDRTKLSIQGGAPTTAASSPQPATRNGMPIKP